MPYALNGDTKIHYEVVGDGLPVVLHTGGAGDLTMWEYAGYVTGLEGYKRILIDHRGHGSSDKPRGLESHWMMQYVGDVTAILDQLGIYRTAFFGYSDGGRVGISLASEFSGRVSALITLGSCVDEDRIRLAQSMRREGSMMSLVESLEREEKITLPEWLKKNFLATDVEMFALELEGFSKWEGAKKLSPKIQAPTRLLTGELEDPNRDCEKIAKLLPRASSIVLPGLGHVGAFLRSDLVLSHVRNFLMSVQEGLDRRYS